MKEACPFHKSVLGVLVWVAVTLLIPSAVALGESGSPDPFFPHEGDPRYNVVHYDVRLNYEPRSGALRARTTIHAVATKALSGISLDLNGLRVRAVTVKFH